MVPRKNPFPSIITQRVPQADCSGVNPPSQAPQQKTFLSITFWSTNSQRIRQSGNSSKVSLWTTPVQHTAIFNGSKGVNRYAFSKIQSIFATNYFIPQYYNQQLRHMANLSQHDLAGTGKLFNPITGQPETIDTLLAGADKISGWNHWSMRLDEAWLDLPSFRIRLNKASVIDTSHCK